METRLNAERAALEEEIDKEAKKIQSRDGISRQDALEKARSGGKDSSGRDRSEQLEMLDKAIKHIEDREGDDTVSRVEIVSPMIVRTEDGGAVQLVPVMET